MDPTHVTEGWVIDGKWGLRRRIGRGGMGEVWVGEHLSLGQEVAVKILDRHAFPDAAENEARSRFHLEATVAARLARKSQHIAAVIDHGTEAGVDYLVMELLVGESLEEALERQGSLEAPRVAEIIRQAARGLAVAHAAGVIHRDLKPSNIFLTTDESGAPLIKLLDFGIAKAWDRSDLAPPSRHRTTAGMVLGTAAYMSPEQARALAIDARTDVWGLAAVAYELLTGKLPFAGASVNDLLVKICTTSPIRPRAYRPELPAAIDEVFARAFARSIDERWSDARSFAEALRRAIDPAPELVPSAARAPESAAHETYVSTPMPTPPPVMAGEQPSRKPILSVAAIAALTMAAALLALGAVFSLGRAPTADAPRTTASQRSIEPFASAEPKPAAPPVVSVAPVPSTEPSAASPPSAAPRPKVNAKPPPPKAPPPPVKKSPADKSEIL